MKEESVINHYLIAALWTAELDGRNVAEISAESIKKSEIDVNNFVKGALPLLKQYKTPMTPAQLGHDFWLTRNHHGVGFWDRDLGELGDKLTELAHTFKAVNVFGENDNKDEIIIE